MDELESFRALLKEHLEGRGAISRLSEQSGLSIAVLSRWRDGIGRPTDRNLRKLAPALGIPYEDLAKMCGYLPGEPSNVDPLEQVRQIEAAQAEAGELGIDLKAEAAREAEGWVSLQSVFGGNLIPPDVAEVVGQAIERMRLSGDVTDQNRWKALEWLAAEYLGGPDVENAA